MPRKFHIGEDSGFSVMPENIYAFRIKNVEHCVASDNAKNPGAEGYNITHEIIDSEDGKFDGRLFWNRFWFLAQNDWTWKNLMNAILPGQGPGENGEWVGDLEIPDPYDLIGLKGKAHLVVGGYKNEAGVWVEKNEVKQSEYYPYKMGESSADWADEPF
jgi:hypothetical protein